MVFHKDERPVKSALFYCRQKTNGGDTMKKLVLQVPLSHKPECFEPERCIVEKTVVLPHRFFESMRLHPMDDSSYIAENRKFMWNDERGAYCVLFLDSEGDDGIMVQAEGYSYARRAQFVPGAKQLAFDAAFTTAEHRIHNALADMAEEAGKRMHSSCSWKVRA